MQSFVIVTTPIAMKTTLLLYFVECGNSSYILRCYVHWIELYQATDSSPPKS
jgi:hypothetical protein